MGLTITFTTFTDFISVITRGEALNLLFQFWGKTLQIRIFHREFANGENVLNPKQLLPTIPCSLPEVYDTL